MVDSPEEGFEFLREGLTKYHLGPEPKRKGEVIAGNRQNQPVDDAQELLFYYITDRTQFSGDENARRRALLAKIGEAACCGVDFIQLREKDLPPANWKLWLTRPSACSATPN